MAPKTRLLSLPVAFLTAWCIGTGIVVGLLGAIRGGIAVACACALVAGFGVALAVIDARTLRLPDSLTGSLAIGAIVLGFLAWVTTSGAGPWPLAGAGALASGTLFFVMAWVRPGALGLGDVKLAAVLGSYVGWFGPACWAAATILTFVLAGAWATWLVLTGRARGPTSIAFGPFLVAGALAGLLCS